MRINTLALVLIYWYSFIFATTEILSFFYQLTRINVLFLEVFFWGGVLFYLRGQVKRQVSNIRFSSKINMVIIAILLLTFVQGFFSAPSTTDSMVYHLPKVMYWVQERTVFQDVVRNIHDFKAPFAEYIVLHLYLISGNDRLAFFSQWLSFAASIYLAGVIAKQLTADKLLQNYSRIFVASLPIAVMQSASTQVDLVVTVLVLVGLHISLLLIKRISLFNGILLGLSLGLGFFTKATYFIYLIIPFGLLFWHFIKKPNLKYFYISMIVIVLALLIQVSFFYQNFSLYGSLMGKHILWDGTELNYTNEKLNVSGLTSNVVRNLFVHIPIPVFNVQVQVMTDNFHNLLGVGLNDERFTCCGTKFVVSPVIYPQEDIIANTVQLILIFTALFFFAKTKGFQKKMLWFLSVLSFILFSAVLKWQPYHSRLEIPIFVTGSIASVLIIGERKEKILKMLAVLSLALAFLVIIFNVSRPYISYSLFYDYVKSFSKPYSVIPEAFYIRSRNEQYFNAEHFWYDPYQELVLELRNENKKINISFELMDDYEYPLWVLMAGNGIDFKVFPRTKEQFAEYLVITSPKVEDKSGYSLMGCSKTEVDYGYACLYNRKD